MLPIQEKESNLFKNEYCHDLDRNTGQKFLAQYDSNNQVLYTSGDTDIKTWDINSEANSKSSKSYTANIKVSDDQICQMHIDEQSKMIYLMDVKGILFAYTIKDNGFI